MFYSGDSEVFLIDKLIHSAVTERPIVEQNRYEIKQAVPKYVIN